MRRLLSFVILLIVRLVAGLPRLDYIDGDSASILQKSDLDTRILTRHLEGFDEKLVRRTNAKGRGIKASQVTSTTKVPSPTPLPAPKHEPKSASAATKDQAGTASPTKSQLKAGSKPLVTQQHTTKQSPITGPRPSSKEKSGKSLPQKGDPIPKPKGKQDLTGRRALPGTKTKEGSQSGSRQKSGNSPQATSNQRTRLGSKQDPAENGVSSGKKRSRAGSTEQTAERSLASSRQQGTQSSIVRPQNKQGKNGLQKDKTSGDIAGAKNRSVIQKGAAGPTRGKGLPSVTKDPINVKATRQGSKRSSNGLSKVSGKGSPQRKRLCRRTNGRESCSLDIEEGGGGISQPSTSQSNNRPNSQSDPQRAPSMVRKMSRASTAFTKDNPWMSATFAMSGASAAMGNGAGLTDHCCNEECAKTAAHALNYCGAAFGVAAAGIAFGGAVINHQRQQEEKKEVANIKMKTEGHEAAIAEHGKKIEQTNEKFAGELRKTKQTLSQVSKRVGGPKLPEDFV